MRPCTPSGNSIASISSTSSSRAPVLTNSPSYGAGWRDPG